MLCFHGMTQKAYYNLFNYANNNVISPWVCSADDGMTYLHTIEFAMEETGECKEEDAKYFAIQQAKESAMIQAAINADSKVYVIEVDLPDEKLEIDYSCNNMEYCRRIDSEAFNKYSKDAIIYSFDVNPAFHGFILAGLVNNEQLNTSEIDPVLLKAAQIISKLDYSEIYDDIYSY